ncbi:MAG: aspartate aminotransferase family protein [Deltaproteobacteria bacterium]|nr:aspartate aminotransferase family protein [Deltaproteobacteria bacterium]
MMRNDEMLSQLKAVECPDATYPARDPALVMHRAKGSLVYDVEGQEYIDLCAGFGALALGHNPDAHIHVLTERLHVAPGTKAPLITHGMGDVYSSAAKVELLKYLPSLMPPTLQVAALALTGSQAVELAVKSAMLATGRSRFVVFGGSYHGLDIGILPLTERADFRAPFRGFLREDRVVSLPFRCDSEELAKVLSSGDIAAVLVEPVQGRTGCREAGVEWLQILRRECDRFGTLLIYDEVFTGLGRTGQYTFGETVPCDLLCLGKAFGGGFPISACVGTDAVMAAWPSSTGEAIHTGTFFGHPLSCDIALATLREIHAGGWVERASNLGQEALRWLRTELKDHGLVREIRGIGLMIVIELVDAGLGAKFMDLLRSKGIIALASGPRGESLSVTPSLNIPRALLMQALATIKVGLQELKGT